MNIVEFQKKAGEDFPFPLEQNFETMLYILSGKQIEFFKVVEVLRDKVFSGIPIQREVIAYHVGNAAWFIMNGYSCSKDTSEDWNLPDIEIPVEMLNAGKDDASVVIDQIKKDKGNIGYDALSDVMVPDMISAGIIDPVKVTRSGIQNASSAAAILLTTEVAIADEPKEEKSHSMPGEMRGMDY